MVKEFLWQLPSTLHQQLSIGLWGCGLEASSAPLRQGRAVNQVPRVPDTSLLGLFYEGASLSTAQDPNLWDLMPDDLRWSLCNKNRNKVHNKCMCLNYAESTPGLHPGPWKNCLPWTRSLVPKRLGTAALQPSLWIQSRDCGLLQGQDLVCAPLLHQTLTHLRLSGYHCQVDAQICCLQSPTALLNSSQLEVTTELKAKDVLSDTWLFRWSSLKELASR